MNNYERIAKAIEYIGTNFKSQPELEDIAKNTYVSPYHLQRLFTEWAGVSPKKFVEFLSLGYAKKLLRETAPLSKAAFDTGLSGTGRLHDLFVKIEGMTPGEYKNKGEGLKINYSFNESPFGKYITASTPKGICYLAFFDDKEQALQELKGEWANAEFFNKKDERHEQVKKFFENGLSGNDKLKLHIKGTPFQLKVWEALLRIPEGQLATYTAIAETVCTAAACRAAGSAIGSNPVAYIIPCHRVIKKAGGIGEYKWGSTRKMAMVGWEASRKR